MQKNRSRLILLGALMTAVLSMAAFGHARGSTGGGRLDGSWNVRVSITNCQTGAVVRSFDSMTQFMTGGTLIDSTSYVPQALKTPGQGIWEHTTGQDYRFKIKAFTYDTAGNYTGYTVVQHDANLAFTGDYYESQGTLEVHSPAGVIVATGCSTTTATRMEF